MNRERLIPETASTPPADPREAAKAAHLRYVSDQQPGVCREKHGNDGFRYLAVNGEIISDEKVLARIASLAIPPAYTNVWICPIANGHLQATGRDAKGRKQYRYHPRWREIRDETKYDRMLAFGDALPLIRARVNDDLQRRGLPREKVLATIVRLLETTRIRVGNEEYARQNDSFGLTTLKNEHVEVNGARLSFHFRGKSGKEHEIGLRDPRIARVVKTCQELPGQELFEFIGEDGARHDIGSFDVNAYLHDIVGQEFTAKDFRTWAGTVLCALCLEAFAEAGTETEAKRNVAAAITEVSERLGNTPAVCRKCYVHPAVVESYLDGSLHNGIARAASKVVEPPPSNSATLTPEESAVLNFLRRRSPCPPQKKKQLSSTK